MKKYSTPMALLTELETRDVITFSIPDVNAKYDDVEYAPDSWFRK